MNGFTYPFHYHHKPIVKNEGSVLVAYILRVSTNMPWFLPSFPNLQVSFTSALSQHSNPLCSLQVSYHQDSISKHPPFTLLFPQPACFIMSHSVYMESFVQYAGGILQYTYSCDKLIPLSNASPMAFYGLWDHLSQALNNPHCLDGVQFILSSSKDYMRDTTKSSLLTKR